MLPCDVMQMVSEIPISASETCRHEHNAARSCANPYILCVCSLWINCCVPMKKCSPRKSSGKQSRSLK